VSTLSDGAAREAATWLVADTQVVLDWLVFDDAAARPLLQAVLDRRLRWLATVSMRTELGHILRHASLAPWSPEIEQALTFFDSHATMAPEPAPTCAPRLLCSDADDQVFIDVALAHHATWLVTRDRALLKLRRKALARGLRIVRPAEWRDASRPAAG
jgi:putative PIN family toxin of toxin-antitoxin system